MTVTPSLRSSGGDPDRATIGDTVTAAGSVRNNTATSQAVTLTVSLRYPNGATYSFTQTVTVGG